MKTLLSLSAFALVVACTGVASAQQIDLPLHRIHSHPTARHVGDLLRGRKAGQQDQAQNVVIAEAAVRGDELSLHRLRPHCLPIDSPAVVFNRDHRIHLRDPCPILATASIGSCGRGSSI